MAGDENSCREIEATPLLMRVLKLDFIMQQPGMALTLDAITAEECMGLRMLQELRIEKQETVARRSRNMQEAQRAQAQREGRR